MKLPLRCYGDPVLRKKAEPVAAITPEIIQLAHDMIETMMANNGVGLAAPQVGHSLRLYVFCDEILNEEGHAELGAPQVAINPVLSHPSKEMEESMEGCLSIPGIRVHVSRPRSIHIRYQNLEGKWIEQELAGFVARVNMHENDHLNGVLHIDRTSAEEKRQVASRLRAMEKKEMQKIEDKE